MTLWLALRRLLPLLAVLSLALTPATAPAAAAGMHAAMVQARHAAFPVDQGRAGMDHAHRHHAGMDHAALDHHGAGSVDSAGMAMDAMPCCPKTEAGETGPEKRDCAKGCPLMALCLASVASLLPAALSVPVPVATRASLSWPDPATFASVHAPPLPEPPRA